MATARVWREGEGSGGAHGGRAERQMARNIVFTRSNVFVKRNITEQQITVIMITAVLQCCRVSGRGGAKQQFVYLPCSIIRILPAPVPSRTESGGEFQFCHKK